MPIVEVPGLGQVDFPEGTPTAEMESAIKNALAERVPIDKQMDTQTGAPMRVRALVGNSRKQEDALANLKQYYPDVQPYGEDNYAFTDPKTGRPTLFNPPGLDVGDVAGAGRGLAQTVGGIVGGAMGAATGPASLWAVPAAAALGSQGAGQMYDIGMRQLGGQIDTRTPLERTAEAGTEMAVETGLGRAGDAVVRGLKGAYSGVRNRLAGSTGQQLLQDYDAAGIPIEGAAGAIMSTRPVQGSTNALAQLPASASVMEEAGEKTMGAITQHADDIARRYSTVAGGRGIAETPEQAGKALQRGATTFTEKFQKKASDLYNNLSRYVAPTDQVPLANTTNMLQGPLARFQNAPHIRGSMVPAKFQGYLDDINANNGALSWEQVKELRSFVGKMADDPRIITDIPKAQWKQFYGSLSEDMKALATTKGPQAVQAFSRANKYYKAGADRIEKVIEPLLNSKTAGAAFDAALAGSRGSGEQLRAIRRSVPKDAWGDFVSVKLQQMGQATPGAQSAQGGEFSVSTFLTNWNRLAPEAKNALFSGDKFQPLKPELDRLARIVGSAKDTQKMLNTSGTAQQSIYMNLMLGGFLTGGAAVGYQAGGAEGAVAVAALPFAFSRMAAKLATNPRFIRLLAQGAQIPPNQTDQLGMHLGRFAALAKANPEAAEEIEQFISAMREAPDPMLSPPPPATPEGQPETR